MVNLTIRLSKGPGGDGSSSHAGPGDGSTTSGAEPAVTVSCPDHLVLADLPVAKGLGSVSDVTVVKILGRKARRRLGDKVHFCVRCNFPIAIYGRLDPCEHIFCLTCARRDSSCYLCGERILRIQRVEVLDGIFICGAPRCLRSFLKRQDFQSHIKEAHADLVEPADDKEDMQHEVNSLKAVPAEPQVHTPSMSRSPSSSLQLPQQEQKAGPVQAQRSENQPSRPQTKSAVSPSTMEEKQVRQNQTRGSSGTKQSDHELHQKQRLNPGGDRTHKRHEKQQEEVHSEDQPQPDLQQAPQPPQPPMPPGPMPASPLVIPAFSPQPFPPLPYHVFQETQVIQPPYPSYQIPHGGHLPPPPPLPPPRPPLSLPPPPPLMPPPPPPPKRGKFEPGIPSVGDSQMDPHGYVWSDGNPNFGSTLNFGGWSGP